MCVPERSRCRLLFSEQASASTHKRNFQHHCWPKHWISMQATMSHDEVVALLDSVEALPASPYPLPELFKALTDPDSDLSTVVGIITFDQALTAKLLQLCNSACFSPGRHINTVAEAINRLGFQTVYRVVASIKGPQIFQLAGKSYGFSNEELWQHAVLSALNAQHVAEVLGEDSGMLFTAGLLHDIGKTLLGRAFHERYECVVAEARREQTPLWKVEQEAFGTNHAEVGARLLEKWKFSPQMVCSIQYHHHPQENLSAERFPAMIQVASALSHAAYPNNAERPLIVEPKEGLDVLGWTEEEMRGCRERMEENQEILRMLLRKGRAREQ
jgi:putative nucleotidyltransferase with HDIG domain